GANADHRLRIAPSLIVSVVASFALKLVSDFPNKSALEALAAPAASHEEWIKFAAEDLKNSKGKALAIGGHRLPLAAQLLVIAINDALDAVGKTIEYRATETSKEGSIAELAASLNGGQVETLVILGGNPAY